MKQSIVIFGAAFCVWVFAISVLNDPHEIQWLQWAWAGLASTLFTIH